MPEFSVTTYVAVPAETPLEAAQMAWAWHQQVEADRFRVLGDDGTKTDIKLTIDGDVGGSSRQRDGKYLPGAVTENDGKYATFPATDRLPDKLTK